MPRRKPGPKPRRRGPTQLELIDSNEACGLPPGYWTMVDRLERADRREVDRVTSALAPLGWVLVTNREGWWMAYSRARHRTERSYTSSGLLRTVRAIESGLAGVGQCELRLGV